MGAASSSEVASGDQEAQMIGKDNLKTIVDQQVGYDETALKGGHQIRRQRSLFRVKGRKSSRNLQSNQSDAAASSFKQMFHVDAMHNFTEAGVRNSGLPGGLVGLVNLGNTCFINSTLQCLSNTIPMTDYFLFYDFAMEINEDRSVGTRGKLVTAYAELMKKMWLIKNPQRLIQPASFLRSLSTFAPQFNDRRQHDAHELLSYLLDGIHEDLKRQRVNDDECIGDRDENSANEVGNNSLRRNHSIVVDIFEGQFRNTCTCKLCGHQNIRLESSMYLSLPISDNCKSLEDCLDLFLEEEELTGDNQWYCENCKKNTDTAKKTDIWALPPILIIHLKRFTYCNFGQDGRKNNTALSYPITNLDLSNTLQRQGGQSLIYDLYAVSNHFGDLDGGHYTAYALNRFSDDWYEFNDTSIRKIDPHETFQTSSTPYLLFYNRIASTFGEPSDYPERAIGSESSKMSALRLHSQVSDRDFRDFERSKTIAEKFPCDLESINNKETMVPFNNLDVVNGTIGDDDNQKSSAKSNGEHDAVEKNKSLKYSKNPFFKKRYSKSALQDNDDSAKIDKLLIRNDTLTTNGTQDRLADFVVNHKKDEDEEEWC